MTVKIEKMVVGPLMTNCYIIYSSGECIVIDPGYSGEEIADFIRGKEYKVKHIFASHGHFDHVSGVKALKDAVNGEFSIGSQDVEMYLNTQEMALKFGGVEVDAPIDPDSHIHEGDIQLGDATVKIIYTPGHTMGSYSFLIENDLFTGDTLFRGSIGRMDYGGSEKYMSETIEHLKGLDDGIRIHPGHGPGSTMGEEKRENPFLNGELRI